MSERSHRHWQAILRGTRQLFPCITPAHIFTFLLLRWHSLNRSQNHLLSLSLSYFPYLWREDIINTLISFSLFFVQFYFILFLIFFFPSLYLLFFYHLTIRFQIMMSFCKKSVNSFLGLNAMDAINDQNKQLLPWKCQQLGLITVTGDPPHRLPNVLESAAIIKPSSSPPPATASMKKDPGGIGFLDDIGGGVDGLMSCTESLGFESSDERRADDDLNFAARPWTKKWRKMGERREVKKFPPPLSSLNQNGQPSFFLRPVRKDGRLELTEVRINRPEILRASREDGRLRLHLVVGEDDTVDEEEQEEEEEQVEEIMEEDKMEDWKFPVSSGEGILRCHEVMNRHHPGHHHHRSNHHHHMPVWSQYCVTTR